MCVLRRTMDTESCPRATAPNQFSLVLLPVPLVQRGRGWYPREGGRTQNSGSLFQIVDASISLWRCHRVACNTLVLAQTRLSTTRASRETGAVPAQRCSCAERACCCLIEVRHRISLYFAATVLSATVLHTCVTCLPGLYINIKSKQELPSCTPSPVRSGEPATKIQPWQQVISTWAGLFRDDRCAVFAQKW